MTILLWILAWPLIGLLFGIVYVFWFHHGPKGMWDFFEYRHLYIMKITEGKNRQIYDIAKYQWEGIVEKRKKCSDLKMSLPLILKSSLAWPLIFLLVWNDMRWQKEFERKQ